MNEKIYPIAVIGGGSAGTMAVLRSVLNNDETLFFPGTPKNKKRSRALWVAKVENVPGHLEYKKGIEDPNRESLKWLSEGEFKEKLHWLKNRGVTEIIKNEDDLFELKDNKGESYLAQYVVLCTGMMDVQPHVTGNIEAIFPFANAQILDYCLRCDGHHVLGKDTVVIGHGNGAAWVATMLYERYETPSMTVLTHGEKPQFDDEVTKLMELYGIEVKTETIVGFDGDPSPKNTRLDALIFEDGSQLKAQMGFISLGSIVYNELAKGLGAEVDGRGFVVTDAKGQSSVQGLYVAGDLRANIKKQIYTAWDTAVDSLDAINANLRRQKRQKLLESKA
jgi:thioredoxin reductase (NADPH)